MNRRRRPNIAKREHKIIFVNDVSRNFPISNLLKQRLAHAASLDGNGLLDHDQIAVASVFGGETFAQILDDLIVHPLAKRAPSLTASELFDATAQPLKA